MNGPKNNSSSVVTHVDTGSNDAFMNQKIKKTAERIMDTAIRKDNENNGGFNKNDQ